MPLLIVGIFYIYFNFRKCLKNQKKSITKSNLMMIFCIAVYACISNILYSLVNLMKCRDFSPGYSFLNSYLEESCLGSRYQNWFRFFILPFFCFYAVFLPFLALFYMLFKRHKKSTKNNFILSFLAVGFKKNKHYWYLILYFKFFTFFREILLFAKKISMVCIVSSLNQNVDLKCLFLLLILIAFVFLNYRNKPFYTKKLNNLEMNQCFTIFLIITSMLIATKISDDPILLIFCVFAVIFLNFQFIFFTIKDIVIIKLAKLQKSQNKILVPKKMKFKSIKNIGDYCSYIYLKFLMIG